MPRFYCSSKRCRAYVGWEYLSFCLVECLICALVCRCFYRSSVQICCLFYPISLLSSRL
ncbi:unnamed protein product [Acanthoscelides obtectus]|uniref:Uncharacterized protein n=1 Tax=Acanthoscelides obtectus TaxID=200917 RepID=A0A9P0LTV3_ACAOB|nr:unnamed protein product [Acanthoscelides obtectus]CAK1671144.1 hypothetical protein AOBTE_LOCUS28084 [Acanthoscelides obtectus]